MRSTRPSRSRCRCSAASGEREIMGFPFARGPSPRERGEGAAKRRMRGATREACAPHPALRATLSPLRGARDLHGPVNDAEFGIFPLEPIGIDADQLQLALEL